MVPPLQQPIKKFTGRKMLIWMLSFFGVIIAVNAVFITKALQSNSGVVTENPYEVGLSYNKILEKRSKQEALGWKGMTAVESKSLLVYTLTDKSGKPITGAKVSVDMLRPVQKGYDFTLPLNDDGNGRYSAKLKVPVAGSWTAHVSVVRDADTYDDVTSLDLE
jgi:nitrogen fixation protein FixH